MDGLVDLFAGPGSYGLSSAVPASASHDTSPGIARSAVSALEHPLSTKNGLFVAGVFIAATFGLIAVSSSARIGTARIGASVGSP